MKNEIETIRAAIKGAFSLLSAIEQNPKRTYVISGDKGALIGSLGALKTIENQFEAIGAGGVEALRKGGCLHQIQEPAAQIQALACKCEIQTTGCIKAKGCRAALAVTPTAAAPVVLPEPDAWRYSNARGHYRYLGKSAGFAEKYPSLKPQPLYTEQQVRALLAGVSAPAAAQGGQQ